MLLNLKLVVLSFLIVINSVDSESINCEAKFISKITKLCRHGISEEKVIHLLSKCCSAHCSKAHLKMFCTMKPHKFERHGNHTE
ncbi:CRE-INS-14 protein [Caenorhabditis remanei]|uniref:CRE-INS-14 protein n=2 Tax=Caenorhabditis remanei TaxID=31234 RepID=E3LQW1_CAERE|nr:CRE-INS-14 protein [Caenorhabditis remanei]